MHAAPSTRTLHFAAIGAAFFTFFYSYLYATLPIEEGERVVALENWDVKRNNEDRRSLHDFVAWRREMKSIRHDVWQSRFARRITRAAKGPADGGRERRAAGQLAAGVVLGPAPQRSTS